ncbi:DET1- and DDB1-associated protein 1-like [Aphis craccivora]|uniref:DET1-and DDB1-associated protein 1-like n=1 Tax=Aphis craccivora TaxID=307492 RepID=A0A6G0VUG2_APHCR|nr:DET1- and DDB1-associated protein 1-like [Aphis craccivora]
MSIEEFLDGMPTFDERNFSQFYPKSSITRRIPVHIKKNITITTDTPSEQDHQVPVPIHKKWDLKFFLLTLE